MAEYYKIEAKRNMYGQVSCQLVPCDKPLASPRKETASHHNPLVTAWDKIRQKVS